MKAAMPTAFKNVRAPQQIFYEELANLLYPSKCKCVNRSGDCDWCHAYYGDLQPDQWVQLAIERAAKRADDFGGRVAHGVARAIRTLLDEF